MTRNAWHYICIRKTNSGGNKDERRTMERGT